MNCRLLGQRWRNRYQQTKDFCSLSFINKLYPVSYVCVCLQSCRPLSSHLAAASPLISPDLQVTNEGTPVILSQYNQQPVSHINPSPTDPSTCAVLPGRETLLEISKGRSGLGLSIVGGRDTQLVTHTDTHSHTHMHTH